MVWKDLKAAHPQRQTQISVLLPTHTNHERQGTRTGYTTRVLGFKGITIRDTMRFSGCYGFLQGLWGSPDLAERVIQLSGGRSV